MITYQPEEIETIEFELRNNKAAIIDTDTVMGIVSFDMKNIYKIKNRPHSKKLVVFLKDFENEEIFNDAEIKILKKYWPGKLTVIKHRVGYRVPNEPTLLKILTKIGHLYSSSANISGDAPITSLQQARAVFEDHENDLILVNNVVKHDKNDKPSTIINLDKHTVIRNGNLDGKKILKEIEECQTTK